MENKDILEVTGTGDGKKGFMTDSTGKPSDTRLKSWVCLIVALLVMVIDIFGKGSDDSMTYFLILFAGGLSWQVAGKVLEAFVMKKTNNIN